MLYSRHFHSVMTVLHVFYIVFQLVELLPLLKVDVLYLLSMPHMAR